MEEVEARIRDIWPSLEDSVDIRALFLRRDLGNSARLQRRVEKEGQAGKVVKTAEPVFPLCMW